MHVLSARWAYFVRAVGRSCFKVAVFSSTQFIIYLGCNLLRFSFCFSILRWFSRLETTREIAFKILEKKMERFVFFLHLLTFCHLPQALVQFLSFFLQFWTYCKCISPSSCLYQVFKSLLALQFFFLESVRIFLFFFCGFLSYTDISLLIREFPYKLISLAAFALSFFSRIICNCIDRSIVIRTS